jgi:hypothetical protein
MTSTSQLSSSILQPIASVNQSQSMFYSPLVLPHFRELSPTVPAPLCLVSVSRIPFFLLVAVALLAIPLK